MEFGAAPACQLASVCGNERHISNSRLVSRSITSTCRSPPNFFPFFFMPSIGAVGGTGYGPGSLWLPYWVNLMATFACAPETTTYGMPMMAPA